MWLLGLLVLYVFYRFYVAWWWGMRLKSALDKPFHWHSTWYQGTLFAFAVILFLLSEALFWSASAWLMLVPIILIPISLVYTDNRNMKSIGRVVGKALAINKRLRDAGVAREVINSEIEAALLSPKMVRGIDSDCDVNTLLKTYILPALGLYSIEADMLALEQSDFKNMKGTQIDEAITMWEKLAGPDPTL